MDLLVGMHSVPVKPPTAIAEYATFGVDVAWFWLPVVHYRNGGQQPCYLLSWRVARRRDLSYDYRSCTLKLMTFASYDATIPQIELGRLYASAEPK